MASTSAMLASTPGAPPDAGLVAGAPRPAQQQQLGSAAATAALHRPQPLAAAAGVIKKGPGGLPNPQAHPRLFLETLLHKMSGLDRDKFFQHPVDESIAPGYYSIIKQGMSFATMKARLAADGYTNWRSFREDFELICSNARRYNAAKTKVHKAASNLLRAGGKMLKQYELDVRKALNQLHPEGAAHPDTSSIAAAPLLPGLGKGGQAAEELAAPEPSVSTGDGTTELTSDQFTDPPNSHRHGGGGAGDATSPPQSPHGESHAIIKLEPGTATEPGVCGAAALVALPHLGPSTAAPYGSLAVEPSTLAAPGWLALPPYPFQPAVPREQLCPYISDADEDYPAAPGTSASRPGHDGLQRQQSGPQQPPPAPPSLDIVLRQMRVPVVRQQWREEAEQEQRQNGAGGTSGVAGGAASGSGAYRDQQDPDQQDREAGQAVPGRAGRSSRGGHTEEWKRERRAVEWRCHWLELRMLDLRAQQRRLQGELAACQQQQQQQQQRRRGSNSSEAGDGAWQAGYGSTDAGANAAGPSRHQQQLQQALVANWSYYAHSLAEATPFFSLSSKAAGSAHPHPTHACTTSLPAADHGKASQRPSGQQHAQATPLLSPSGQLLAGPGSATQPDAMEALPFPLPPTQADPAPLPQPPSEPACTTSAPTPNAAPSLQAWSPMHPDAPDAAATVYHVPHAQQHTGGSQHDHDHGPGPAGMPAGPLLPLPYGCGADGGPSGRLVGEVDDADLVAAPAVVTASLDLLDRQLSQLRARLLDTFKLDSYRCLNGRWVPG